MAGCRMGRWPPTWEERDPQAVRSARVTVPSGNSADRDSWVAGTRPAQSATALHPSSEAAGDPGGPDPGQNASGADKRRNAMSGSYSDVRLSGFQVPRFPSSLPGRARWLVVFFRGRSKKFRTHFNIDVAATTGVGPVRAREIGRKPKLFDRVPAHLQGRKVDRSIHCPPLAIPNKAGASSFVTAHG